MLRLLFSEKRTESPEKKIRATLCQKGLSVTNTSLEDPQGLGEEKWWGEGSGVPSFKMVRCGLVGQPRMSLSLGEKLMPSPLWRR